MDMTWDVWQSLPEIEKAKLRDTSGLSPQLVGLEGWRVEVMTTYGEKRRFIVGRSTGWKPCHIEISRRNAFGGPAAEQNYANVRTLYHVR